MPDTISVLNIVLQPYQFCRAALAAHTRSTPNVALRSRCSHGYPPPLAMSPPFVKPVPPLWGAANTFNSIERVYSRAIAFSNRRCSVPLESMLPTSQVCTVSSSIRTAFT